ncbi:MAG: hypothetical protein WCO71_05435, partial [Pseudomonadota bacterium]
INRGRTLASYLGSAFEKGLPGSTAASLCSGQSSRTPTQLVQANACDGKIKLAVKNKLEKRIETFPLELSSDSVRYMNLIMLRG